LAQLSPSLFSLSPAYGLHNIAYVLHNIAYGLHKIAYGLNNIAYELHNIASAWKVTFLPEGIVVRFTKIGGFHPKQNNRITPTPCTLLFLSRQRGLFEQRMRREAQRAVVFFMIFSAA
jgi:hypothetical protein